MALYKANFYNEENENTISLNIEIPSNEKKTVSFLIINKESLDYIGIKKDLEKCYHCGKKLYKKVWIKTKIPSKLSESYNKKRNANEKIELIDSVFCSKTCYQLYKLKE